MNTSVNTTKPNSTPPSAPILNLRPKKTKSPSQKANDVVLTMNLVGFDPCITPNPTHTTLKKSKCLLSTLFPLPLSIASLPRLTHLSSCTNYQHQFRQDHNAETAPVPYDRHVFQSIFLDASNRDFWTIDEISPDKVIEKKWWHQLGHRWQHYARVVPGMMFINGKNQTWFAGSWTLVVCISFLCL